jgi:hypothetical protein
MCQKATRLLIAFIMNSGAGKMAFRLQSILQVGSSSDLTTTPLGIDTEATNNPQ